MCGRFVSISTPDGLARFFMVDTRAADELPPSYNVAPTDPVYAVTEHREERALEVFRWGLVPHWSDDRKIASRLVNARAESLRAKPAFRDAFERRRCLVPADGFYEWQRRDERTTVPYFIHSRGGTPLALAGLWEIWSDPAAPDAEPLRTCTIITTRANPDVSSLHDRMPVLLAPQHWDAWLDRDFHDEHALEAMLQPPGSGALSAHPVSTEVNSVRNNHPGLLVPAADQANSPPST